MVLIVDSNVFIGMERRGLGIADLFRVGPDEPVALASITAAELLIGVMRSPPSPRNTLRALFVEAICQRLPVLPFDLAAARIHAWIWTELAAAGKPIGPHDLLIAATALSNDHAVLTDNIGEFRRVPGLVVLQPSWPS
jgi:predicted nucleic acid-binding protein